METTIEEYNETFIQCIYLLDDAGAVKLLPELTPIDNPIQQPYNQKHWPVILKMYAHLDTQKFYKLVAVHSYLDVELSDAECIDIATDWMNEEGYENIRIISINRR